MMKLLACLYGRMIANRLKLWLVTLQRQPNPLLKRQIYAHYYIHLAYSDRNGEKEKTYFVYRFHGY